ncbi:MAG: T9SS type A sorting domain-containing protein, partial [Bacteroidetes bacterium]|nr:T9SS type A sorting domain-containing protein [Bacteroidota bacterium]
GIQLVKTHKARVFTNKVSFCGAGLFVLQDNLQGNAVCNEFFDTYSGVVWSSVGTGEFGVSVMGGPEKVYGFFAPDASSDNRWTTSVPSYDPIRSYSINLSEGVTIDWYYRSAATFDFPTGTNLFLGPSPTSALDAVVGTIMSICDTLALFREGEFPGGGQDSFNLSHFRESEMDSHLTAPNPATISDGLYAFLSAANRSGFDHDKVQTLVNQTSIEDFTQVESYWMEGDFVSATSALNSIVPINTDESYLQDVWAIRLQHSVNDPDAEWSEDEAIALGEIAYRDLEEAGSTAILAQSLLGLTLLPNDWVIEDMEERLATSLVETTRIFPNPAQTVVYLDANKEAANAVFTDLQGQVKRVVRMEAESTSSVDISNLPPGIYIVQITQDSGSINTYKLFITR